jgi:hypothetical protein
LTIKRFTEQGLLVPESGVEAGTVNAHGLGQIGKRGSFVAFLPEDPQSSLQGFVDIKGPGAAEGSAGSRYFHTERYNKRFDSLVSTGIIMYRKVDKSILSPVTDENEKPNRLAALKLWKTYHPHANNAFCAH